MYRILLTASVLLSTLNVFAQCTLPAYPASSTTSTYAELPNNGSTYVTYTSSNTYAYTGTGTVKNINFSGDTLYVYGNLTITTSSTVAGYTTVIVVEPGATLTLASSFHLNGPVVIVNYGTLIMQTAPKSGTTVITAGNGVTTLSGTSSLVAGATLINATKYATTDIVSNNFTSTGTFINNGTLNFLTTSGGFAGVTFNSGTSVCLGDSSHTSFGSLSTNSQLIVSPSTGQAQVSVLTNLTVNPTSITNTSGLKLCLGKDSSSYNLTKLSPAVVKTNCTATTNLLPVVFRSFQLKVESADCAVLWTTGSEVNLADFVVEYSMDGETFLPMATVAVHNEPSSYRYATTLEGRTWFRIKAVDAGTGVFTYSAVLMADYAIKGASLTKGLLKVQPNIISNNILQVYKTSLQAEAGVLLVYDIAGRLVLKQDVSFVVGTNSVALNLHGLGSGLYILVYEHGGDKQLSVRFCVVQ